MQVGRVNETTGDIWAYVGVRCIVVPVNCLGVMGRGVAKQAADKFCGLQRTYQNALAAWSEAQRSEPAMLARFSNLIMFPVKYHWRDEADLNLIRRNLGLLRDYGTLYAMPELGCGFGEKRWSEVEPVVMDALATSPTDVLIIHPSAALRQKYEKSFRAAETRRDERFS